jgi:GGDEF domain-containing protein
MKDLYFKDENGDFIPIEFKKIVSKSWNNKLVVVRVGSDEFPVTNKDIEDEVVESISECLNQSSILEDFKNVSFMIVRHNVDFKVAKKVDTKDNIVIKTLGKNICIY